MNIDFNLWIFRIFFQKLYSFLYFLLYSLFPWGPQSGPSLCRVTWPSRKVNENYPNFGIHTSIAYKCGKPSMVFPYVHYSHGQSSIGLLIMPRDISLSDRLMKHTPAWEFMNRFISSKRLAPLYIMMLYLPLETSRNSPETSKFLLDFILWIPVRQKVPSQKFSRNLPNGSSSQIFQELFSVKVSLSFESLEYAANRKHLI